MVGKYFIKDFADCRRFIKAIQRIENCIGETAQGNPIYCIRIPSPVGKFKLKVCNKGYWINFNRSCIETKFVKVEEREVFKLLLDHAKGIEDDIKSGQLLVIKFTMMGWEYAKNKNRE